MTRVWYRLLWLPLALVLPGCTKFDVLNATVPPLGYCRTSGLAYGESPRQKLDVYEPSQKLDRAAPVVVFFYGGSWQFGERRNYRFVGQALADHGIVAVLPDYRLYPEVTFPGFVEDGAKAVRWTHDNIARFGGDPSRVFLMGHSAGAHIATLLALDEHYLKDVGLMLEAAEAAGQPLPLSQAHARLMRDAIAAGDGDLDNAAIIRQWRRGRIPNS